MRTILAFARASIGSSAYYRGAIVVWTIITLVRAVVAIAVAVLANMFFKFSLHYYSSARS